MASATSRAEMSSVWTGVIAAVLFAAAVAVHRGPHPGARLGAARGGPVPRTHSAHVERVLRWRSTGLGRLRRGSDESTAVRMVIENWSRRLRAGTAAGAALSGAIEDVPHAAPVLARTHATLAVGGDVLGALRADSDRLATDLAPRALLACSACWSLAEHHGGRLADALDRVADGIRTEEQHRSHVRAELAGSRASARLLAVLPLFALLLASGLGMNPLTVLLSDPFGRVALVAGLALDATGLWWTARIAHAAERSS